VSGESGGTETAREGPVSLNGLRYVRHVPRKLDPAHKTRLR
jgi:hypothetical protein